MEIGKIVKKAMIDKEISGAVELRELTGLSTAKCYRLMQGDKTMRLNDTIAALELLGVKVKFISEGV